MRRALKRLRWRRSGAWQWPAFGAALLLESISLHELPISGEHTALAGGLLLAALLNLLVVAVLAPLLGLAVRRRRRDLPRVVARDHAATALIAGMLALIVGLGLLHRPSLVAARQEFSSQSDAVRRYVHLQAPSYLARVDEADSWRIDQHLYRTCVPGGGRWLCLYVNTDSSPPGVTLDSNHAPNSTYIGPHAVGRSPG